MTPSMCTDCGYPAVDELNPAAPCIVSQVGVSVPRCYSHTIARLHAERDILLGQRRVLRETLERSHLCSTSVPVYRNGELAGYRCQGCYVSEAMRATQEEP